MHFDPGPDPPVFQVLVACEYISESINPWLSDLFLGKAELIYCHRGHLLHLWMFQLHLGYYDYQGFCILIGDGPWRNQEPVWGIGSTHWKRVRRLLIPCPTLYCIWKIMRDTLVSVNHHSCFSYVSSHDSKSVKRGNSQDCGRAHLVAGEWKRRHDH